MKINKMKVILAVSVFVMVTNIHANNKCIAAQKAYVDYSKLKTEWCVSIEELMLSKKTLYEFENAEKNCMKYTKKVEKMHKRALKECKDL